MLDEEAAVSVTRASLWLPWLGMHPPPPPAATDHTVKQVAVILNNVRRRFVFFCLRDTR